MTTTIVPPSPNPAQADALRARLQANGMYFKIDLTADDTDPATLRAELAEIAGRLHVNDLACLWLQAKELEGTMPDAALFASGPRKPLAG